MQQINYPRLCALVDKVGFGKDTEGPFSLRVNIGCQFEDLLSRDVHVGRNDCKHDRARIFHVAKDYTTYEQYVFLGGHPGGGVFENPWDIDDAQVLLSWPADL